MLTISRLGGKADPQERPSGSLGPHQEVDLQGMEVGGRRDKTSSILAQ